MKSKLDIDHYFSDDHPLMLDEETYKDIMNVVNPMDLPHRDYAPLLRKVEYLETRGNTMKFFVVNEINGWPCYIQFMDWDAQVADPTINVNEASRLLLWGGNIRIHCKCPSFVFYGYEYILTQLGAAIFPENRFPHIKNPQLKGIACKHLRRCLKVLPFNMGYIASEIKRQRMGLGNDGVS